MRGHPGTAHDESATASGARDTEARALDGATVQHAGKEGGKALPLNSLPTAALSNSPALFFILRSSYYCFRPTHWSLTAQVSA